MIIKDDQILLGMKKRGFGVGKWNGFGGKVQTGESIEAAARREVNEEIGINIIDMEKVGLLEFESESDQEILEVHIFKVSSFSGEPQESEEMKPEWFQVTNPPFSAMWLDDPYWFPYLVAQKRFKGKFLFKDYDTLLKYSIEEVEGVE